MDTPKALLSRSNATSASVFILVSVAISLLHQGCGLPEPTDIPGQPTLVLGERIEVLQDSAPPMGKTLTVAKPGDPLDGLTITVPEGAYSDAVSIAVSHRSVLESALPGGAIVLTPLITIENGGAYAEHPMTVRIPVSIPADYFAMAFYYDESTGELEAIPWIERDAGSLTIVTRHFSDAVVTGTPNASTPQSKKSLEFQPGQDDWHLPNDGSYYTEDGNCSGMALTAMWYFLEKACKGQPRLRQVCVDHLNPVGKTPDFWLDDAMAVKLVSVVQKHYADILTQEIPKFDVLTHKPSATFRSFASALATTGMPQLMVAFKDGQPRHLMICYKQEGNLLYVADPSAAGATNRTIELNTEDDYFETYLSGPTKGQGAAYGKLFFLGQWAFFNPDKLAGYWADFENGRIGDGDFPRVDLIVAELDEKANAPRQFTLDPTKDNHVTHDALKFVEVLPGMQVGARIWRQDDLSYHQGQLVALKPGKQILGFHLAGQPSFVLEGSGPTYNPNAVYWSWFGFQWVSVVLWNTTNQKSESHETYIGDGYFNTPDGELSTTWGTELSVSGIDGNGLIRVAVDTTWANRNRDDDPQTVLEDPTAGLDMSVHIRAVGELGGLTDELVVPLSGGKMEWPAGELAPLWLLQHDLTPDSVAGEMGWTGMPLQVKVVVAFKNQGSSGYIPTPARDVVRVTLRVWFTPLTN